MIRNSYIRRLLVALLVLLTVTPQGLLRPCCCSRDQSLAASSQIATADSCEAENVVHQRESERVGSPANQSTANQSTSQAVAEHTFRPCCQQRLEAARQAALKSTVSSCCRSKIRANLATQSNSRQAGEGNAESIAVHLVNGVNDTHNCCCHAASETPRIERIVFRQIDVKDFAILNAADSCVAVCPVDFGIRMTAYDNSSGLRLRPESSRLCRWVI